MQLIYKALLAIMLLISPAWATWTMIQDASTTTNHGCSGTTCAATVASTGAHHALWAGSTVNTAQNITITGVTAGACNVAWVELPSTRYSYVGNGSGDLAYCADSVAGITTITGSFSGTGYTGGGGFGIWEASSSLGNIAIDSGSVPDGVNTTNGTVNCTACVGVGLTLSGNNNFIVGVAICAASCTAVTGTGCVFDTSVSGQGYMHCVTSGSVTAPATWTQTSGLLECNAGALQESSGAAAVPAKMILQ